MEQVNGDMEDLFRRAAAKYPLRTDSADWDRLAAALDKDPGPPSGMDTDDKRRRRGIFWWWLLLPLVGGLGFYAWRATVRPSTHLSKAVVGAGGKEGGAAAATQQGGGVNAGTAEAGGMSSGGTNAGGAVAAGTQGGGTSAGTAEGGGTSSGGTNAGGTATAGTQAGVTANGGKVGGTLSGDEVAPVRRRRLAGSATGGSARATGGSTLAGRTSAGRGAAARRGRLAASAGDTGDVNTTSEGHTTSGAHTTSDDNFDAANIGGINSGSKMSKQGADRPLLLASPDWRRASTAGSFNLVVSVKAPVVPKDSSAKPAKKATAKSKGHGYIGLTGAPDVSTVRMQSVNGVGTTWGLVLGYSFNNHWAVESGVSLDQKKYYTAGEYFSKSADASLYGKPLQYVNGTCNMWEIPLNIRYNFNPGSKITWFATTGLSTYFMTKQQYNYEFQYNGGASWNENWTTTAPSNYLFSVINISGGFEQRIGSIGNLRIEPYLRIPLSGIGAGKLPIMSAGLNVGITRRLW